MGVQSFVERDLKQLGRPQQDHQVQQAIESIRQSGVKVFNLDLIYGNQAQSEADWMTSLDQALSHNPEELFLYPLYVRALTGLGRSGRNPAENRRHLYGLARERLLKAGYRQISMRMFRHQDTAYSTQHCCQEDGMVGLGPGARSYTASLHYSTDYAVSGSGVRDIIDRFNRRDDESIALIDYGVRLSVEDQRRRYLIRSLLLTEGLDCLAFERQFGCDVAKALPQVQELIEEGFAQRTGHRLCLSSDGLAHSDVIGPWLYGDAVRERMESFAFK